MKIILRYFITSIFLIVFFSTSFAQIVMMSSNPLKKKEILLYYNYQFYTNTKQFNWVSGEWDKIDNSSLQTYHKTLPMIGYGITGKLAMYAQFPLNYFIQPEGNTFYINDILIMSRYAIIPSSNSKSGITLMAAINVPTGKTGTNKNFSDGSTDFLLGEIFSTKWYSNWRTHIKSSFTFSTKNINNETLGNEINLYLKQDYKWGKMKFVLTNQYFHQFNKLNEEKERITNTFKTRIIHLFMVEYKLKNELVLKPKFQIPSYAVGSSKYDYKFIFEIFYKFS